MEYLEKIKKLIDKNFVYKGNFTLSSGAHSDMYVDVRAAMLSHPLEFSIALAEIAERYDSNVFPVATGAAGALILALSDYRGYLYNPKDHGVPWSPILPANTDVYLIDDVLTTGGTLAKLREAVKAAGCTIHGEHVLYERKI